MKLRLVQFNLTCIGFCLSHLLGLLQLYLYLVKPSVILGLHEALAGHDSAILSLLDETLVKHALDDLTCFGIFLSHLLGLLKLPLHLVKLGQLLLNGLLLHHGLLLLIEDLLLGPAPLRTHLHQQSTSTTGL